MMPSVVARTRSFGDALLWAYCTMVFLFLLAPILVIVPLSFSSSTFFSYPIPSWSFHWYEAFFSNTDWRNAIKNSFMIGFATSGVATPLGIIAALGLRRSNSRFKGIAFGMFIAPLIVPVIITACGLYFFLVEIHLINTFPGLIASHVVIAVPFVIVMVTAALNNLDPALPRAAAGLGAPPLRVFFDITLPLILPGVVAAAVLAFVASFDDVIIVNFVAGVDQTTMPKELWKGIRDETSPLVLSVSTVMIAVSTVVLAVVEIARRKTGRANANPKK
jgi:putative spermidine/putrescine transport system permease protein